MTVSRACLVVLLIGLLSWAGPVSAQAPAEQPAFKVGQAAEVEWGGRWWPAEVMEIKDGKFFIHYSGWNQDWDEWVTKDRVRPAGQLAAVKPPEAKPADPPGLKVSQKVDVEWGGQWWPAEVMEIKGDKYFIHYTGWGKEWDEWVTKERIRALAKADGAKPAAGGIKVNDKVEVEWGGKWWPAEVVQIDGQKYFIHYTGWGKEWDEWVTKERIRALAKANAAKPAAGGIKVNDKVEVEWGGKWWPAEVVQIDGEKHFIHYTGWGKEWDEWVTKERIRALAKADGAKPAAGAIKVNDKVEVEWGGKWWPAEVVQIDGEKHFIHYTGWGKEWDEWVTKERIRALAKADGAKPAAGAIKVNDKVDVEWGGRWWPAEVVEIKGEKYFIHYTGWGKEWDEWVGNDRIRAVAVQK